MFNKPKKLKKIPSDLVSYIQIETEAIKDANDKMVRDQLMACHKAIMGVKITNPNDRPLLDIKYPKGYEG